MNMQDFEKIREEKIQSLKKGAQYAKQYLKNELKKKLMKKVKLIILKYVLPFLLGALLLFIIIMAFLGLFSAAKDAISNIINGEEEHIPTLTIGEDGLFKTTAKKQWHLFTSNTYKYYAVLDEAAFREYITSKNFDTKFSKDNSMSDFFENQNDFLNGNYVKQNQADASQDNTNNSTDNDTLDEKEYGFLKELIIRLTAAAYPEDVEFVLNKTLIFDSEEEAKNKEFIEEKINEIVEENDTKLVAGGVTLHRNGSKIKFVPSSLELDDASYTMNNGYIVVKYVEKGTESTYPTGDERGGVHYKNFDLQELVAPYIMDIDFIAALNSRLGSEQFLYYLSLLISKSHIDVGIYENVTNTTVELEETYHVDNYKPGTKKRISSDEIKEEKTENKVGKNLKIWVMNVDNWVATIHNEIIVDRGPEQEIYNNTYNQDNYEELIKKLKDKSILDLAEKIEDRVKKFMEEKTEYYNPENDDEDIPEEDKVDKVIKLKEIEFVMRSQTTEYKLDEKKSTFKDNTDYFCGLLRNSTSNALFSNTFYTPESEDIKDLNAYTIKTSGNSDIKTLFHKFDQRGRSMLYAETGTNRLICPDYRLSNESQRQEFLVISDGKYDETINLIWDKLCGIKDGTTIKDIPYKELEPPDINETYLELKSFIKSMEGTTYLIKNKTNYHVSYLDSKGIPTTGWGLNLYSSYERFAHYLGEIVYTPAFYIAAPEGKNNESNSFLIPDNIVEIIFNEKVNEKEYNIIKDINNMNRYKFLYTLANYESDALVYVTWWFGNYGGADHYIACINDALKRSGRENSIDRSDRGKLFIYYDYLKKNVHEALNYYNGAKPAKAPILLLYTHGLYYRRTGELFAAATKPLGYALELYEKLVAEGYTYDENPAFYQQASNADESAHYGQAQYNSEKVKLTVNDYMYVTWVFKDLGYLSQAYTNYDSFMEGTLFNKQGKAEDLNKFDIVDNTGENGVPKTIKSRDDLLPGDIVIVKENNRNSIKIFGGRNNWIEMNNDTLEELKMVEENKKSEATISKARRDGDNKSTLWKLITPIANYKGGAAVEGNNMYGNPINIDNILWVYRNKDLANNYIFNDSCEYTDYKIENHMLTRKSSSDPQDAVL